MGIRVHKDIGYFISNKNFKNIFKKNYEDIIDDNYSLKKELLEEILQELQGDNVTIFEKYELENYLKGEKYFSTDFIKQIFNGDKTKGMLLKTPEFNKYCRYDDLIDYYEENETNCRFKIQYLHSPIYPIGDYICLKIPDVRNYKELKVDDKINSNDLRHLFFYRKENEKMDNFQESFKTWVYPKKNQDKYFHPYIHVMSFLFCKKMGLLKDEQMKYTDFIQYFEPAIVTYWC